MTIHLVSFVGLAPGADQLTKRLGNEQQLRQRQRALHHSAIEFGGIDACHEWNRERLIQTNYYRQNKRLLDHAKGCGYWAWKPFIILETLQQLEADDYVIYCDVGRPIDGSPFDHGNIIETSLVPLVEWAEENRGMLPGVYLANHGAAKHWIKRDCFKIMHCDEVRYHDSPSVQAGYSVWKNTPEVRAFLSEWQTLNLDPRLVSDDENTLGFDNYEGFNRHAHDQATLTLLCEREGVTVFGNRQHQFWGFRNINYIAKEAAFQLALSKEQLRFGEINNETLILPKHLERWLELLTLAKRADTLAIGFIGVLRNAQAAAWKKYFPNSTLIDANALNKKEVFDLLVQTKAQDSHFDNRLLFAAYASLKQDGLMLLGPLPQDSEFEDSARTISNTGQFPLHQKAQNDELFDELETVTFLPKIHNSRNPIFLSGKSGKYCLMIRPKSLQDAARKSL